MKQDDINPRNNDNKLILNIPTSDTDIRKMYLSRRISVLKNLPIPKVERIEDHSYV